MRLFQGFPGPAGPPGAPGKRLETCRSEQDSFSASFSRPRWLPWCTRREGSTGYPRQKWPTRYVDTYHQWTLSSLVLELLRTGLPGLPGLKGNAGFPGRSGLKGAQGESGK